MAFKCCAICNKGVQIGHNMSHAKNRTRHVWNPNLQNKKVWVDDHYERLRLCVKCLRTVKEMQLTPEARRDVVKG